MASRRWYDRLFPDRQPIFITGAARSGTSAVADMLRLGAGIPGSWEGYGFHLAYLMLGQLETHWRQIGPPMQQMADDSRPDPEPHRTVRWFDFGELKRDVLRHFDAIYQQRYGNRWLDKTPERHMLHAAPMLAGAYPQGRFLFVYRNGIRVIESRRITHPEMGFGDGCDDWAGMIEDWLSHRQRLGPRFLPVRYEDLIDEPALAVRRIADHLELDATTVGPMIEVLRTHQVARTSANPGAQKRLRDTDWSPAQQELFRQRCGEAMAGLGYDL